MEKRIIGENLILIFHTKFNILPLVNSIVISKNFDFEYAKKNKKCLTLISARLGSAVEDLPLGLPDLDVTV